MSASRWSRASHSLRAVMNASPPGTARLFVLHRRRGRGSIVSRFAAFVTCLSTAFVLAVPVAAHPSPYAWTTIDVRRRESGLRWVFNRTFPDYGPHEVRCWGYDRVRLSRGGTGYRHIRCRIESMAVPDFIYHIDNRGRTRVARAWG